MQRLQLSAGPPVPHRKRHCPEEQNNKGQRMRLTEAMSEWPHLRRLKTDLLAQKRVSTTSQKSDAQGSVGKQSKYLVMPTVYSPSFREVLRRVSNSSCWIFPPWICPVCFLNSANPEQPEHPGPQSHHHVPRETASRLASRESTNNKFHFVPQ